MIIDGQAYSVVGNANGDPLYNGSVAQTAITFTSTSTTFSMQAGPMDVNVTFLSPIEVYSYFFLRQQSGY